MPSDDPKLRALFQEVDLVEVTEQTGAAFHKILDKASKAADEMKSAAPTPHPKTDEDPKTAFFRRIAETGDFDLRDAAGQQWSRHLKANDDIRKQYDNLPSRADKAEFRRSWAQKRFSKFVQTKTFEQGFSVVDSTMGEYVSFGTLVERYGGWGWKPAVDGAKRCALRCTALGGSWIYNDSFSGLRMFLLLRREHNEVMAKKWSEFERQIHEGDIATPQGDGAEPSEAAPSTAIKPGKGGKSEAQASPTPKPANDSTLKEATRVKGLISKATLWASSE